MPHQDLMLKYAMQNSYPALFVEMRLGKTLVAIRWARYQHHIARPGRILVVAPKAVLPTWQYELSLEAVPVSRIFVVNGSKERRLKTVATHTVGWFLINYEALRVTPEFASYDFDCIILDESTKIRNPKAQITKFLVKNFRDVPSRCILSGMPAPESPMDYFCQMQFLNNRFLGYYNYWNMRKSLFKQYGYEWFPKMGVLEYIKKEVHTSGYVLTRRQAGIGSKKIYEKRYVEMNPEQKRVYKQIEKDFSFTIKDVTVDTKWNPVKLTWMSRIAGGYLPEPLMQISNAKTLELYGLLTGELKGEQVVVWFRFNEELRQVVAFLKSKRIGCFGIMGETDTDTRNSCIEQFKNRNVQVLCVQIKCGKFGVDWSCASTAIYYSNSYEMEDRAQSEDRILHPMKKEPLLYIDLITKDTVDEDVVETLLDKRVSARYFMMRLVENWRKRYGKN